MFSKEELAPDLLFLISDPKTVSSLLVEVLVFVFGLGNSFMFGGIDSGPLRSIKN